MPHTLSHTLVLSLSDRFMKDEALIGYRSLLFSLSKTRCAIGHSRMSWLEPYAKLATRNFLTHKNFEPLTFSPQEDEEKNNIKRGVYLRHLPCSWNIQPWSHKNLQLKNASKSKGVTISSHASTALQKEREYELPVLHKNNIIHFTTPSPWILSTHSPPFSNLKILPSCLVSVKN